jgi:hypothetical protein
MKPKRKTYWLDMTPEEIREYWQRRGLGLTLILVILAGTIVFLRNCGGAT